jgi:hypothetical protein
MEKEASTIREGKYMTLNDAQRRRRLKERKRKRREIQDDFERQREK